MSRRTWSIAVVVLLAGLLTVFGSASFSQSVSADGPRELARFASNQFPEGMGVAPDGTVLAGVINTGEILRVDTSGNVSKLGQIPLTTGYVTGVYAFDSRTAYALVLSTDDKNGVWRVGETAFYQLARFPAGMGGNDIISDSKGTLYVTDMIGGRIIRVGRDGRVDVWAQDALLLGNVQSPGPFGIPIGANGLDFTASGDALYVGVGEKGRLVRIPVRPDGSAGPITVVAESPMLNGIDGLEVATNGLVYAAIGGQNAVIVIDPATGRFQTALSGLPLRGPSSVRFSPDGKQAYVLNFQAAVWLGFAPGPAAPGVVVMDASTLLSQRPATPPAAPPPPRPAEPIVPPRTGDGGLIR